MAHPLLPFDERPQLKTEYFPTPFQCFLYRNHTMITASLAARVLATDEATVIAHAEAMGLPGFAAPEVEGMWLTRGYITLIRANWHLLTYPQLCTLLGWDADYLAFILHEDDFLDIKLGKKKPAVNTLAVTELTPEQKRMTDAIRRVTLEVKEKIGAPSHLPFDFDVVYSQNVSAPKGKSRFLASFCHSFCALYGDTFLDERLIEASFPDSLLRAYAALGISGVWTQAVLYTLIPCEYDLSLSKGWEQRIRGLNLLIKRLARYGLKLYLYINEPREVSDKIFESRPELRGDVYHEGFSSLCLSVPEVQDFLRNSIRRLTELAPGLGGYITITSSENHTNCYSHKLSGQTSCPRCLGKTRSDLYSLVNRLIYEGATAADPSVTVMAYNWGWDREEGSDEATVAGLPKEVAVLGVSERGKEKTIGGVTVKTADYSISIPGPSDFTMNRFRIASEHGCRIAAKVQLNNSWELCSVPYLPAFGHFYQAIRNLVERADPEILMMTWTHGGFPSPVLAMVSKMTKKGEPMPKPDDLFASLYPNADRDALLSAIRTFDEAFDEYPFSVGTMYNGPQHMGPALPLWRESTGYTSCMIGPPYDDITGWRNVYPLDVYRDQLEKLTSGLYDALALFRAAYEGKELTTDDRVLLDCAEGSYLHFASAYNHVLYVLGREEGDSEALAALVRREEELAIAEARLVGRNPAIGYEASNHYLFTETDLFEKVLNCRMLLGEL